MVTSILPGAGKGHRGPRRLLFGGKEPLSLQVRARPSGTGGPPRCACVLALLGGCSASQPVCMPPRNVTAPDMMEQGLGPCNPGPVGPSLCPGSRRLQRGLGLGWEPQAVALSQSHSSQQVGSAGPLSPALSWVGPVEGLQGALLGGTPGNPLPGSWEDRGASYGRPPFCTI